MSSRTRILMVDNLAVESARRAVYRSLAKRSDLEVHLLVPKSWKEQGKLVVYEEEREGPLHIHLTDFLFGYRFHRVVYTGLFRTVHKIQPHFLYVDAEPENYAALEALAVRRLLSPSMKLGLVSSRNLDHREIGFPYRASFTHWACDTMVRRSKVDIMFVRTKAALKLIGRYAWSTCHIPFPVDCTHFKKENLGKLAPDGKSTTIGFLGRLVESKGVRLLVESLPQLPRNVQLLIVGKGPLANELRSLAVGLNVSERVTIVPPVTYSEVPRLLNAIDILVLPSLNTKFWLEQCPRVLIEAMACEVPLVASDSGGIPEVVGDAALLFRVGDLDDLVNKLLQYIRNDSLRAEMARKGRARALTLYDVRIIADRIADVMLTTLERQP